MSFADHILDGVTPQVFLLAFDDKTQGFNLLSSLEGDFTTDPVSINRPYFTGEDIRFGCVPSATLSCTLQNADKRYSGFPYGKARAYIGTYEGATTVSAFEVDGVEIIPLAGMNDELIIGQTEITDTRGVSNVFVFGLVQDYYVYLVDENDKVRKISVSDPTDDTVLDAPCEFFRRACEKYDYRITLLDTWDEYQGAFSLRIYDGQNEELYELCPVGVFNIERPRSSSTTTISLLDAFDDMRRMDVSCGDFVQKIQSMYPAGTCSIENFVETLLEDFDYQYFITYPNITVRTDLFQKKDYTYRELLKFAAEAMCKVLYFDAAGNFEFSTPSEDPLVPPLTDAAIFPETRIAANGYDRADYKSTQYQGVNLYLTDGTVWFSGNYVEESVYVIADNPLIDVNALQDADYVSRVGHLASYHPVIVSVTEMNPALRPGSTVSIQNIYTGDFELVPLWNINILWAGKTFGTLIAGGQDRVHY